MPTKATPHTGLQVGKSHRTSKSAMPEHSKYGSRSEIEEVWHAFGWSPVGYIKRLAYGLERVCRPNNAMFLAGRLFHIPRSSLALDLQECAPLCSVPVNVSRKVRQSIQCALVPVSSYEKPNKSWPDGIRETIKKWHHVRIHSQKPLDEGIRITFQTGQPVILPGRKQGLLLTKPVVLAC